MEGVLKEQNDGQLIHDIHDVMFYTEAPKKDRAFATSFESKQ